MNQHIPYGSKLPQRDNPPRTNDANDINQAWRERRQANKLVTTEFPKRKKPFFSAAGCLGVFLLLLFLVLAVIPLTTS
ncbi:hypothetical protein OAU50_05730 [Planctomycetota bacterium]|nr:hypothetical protein [Planctomycetota bacterium]